MKPVVKPGGSATGGFGLFSIRERMLALGGRFDLKASPGKGTEATLVLPITNVSSERSEGDNAALVVSTDQDREEKDGERFKDSRPRDGRSCRSTAGVVQPLGRVR